MSTVDPPFAQWLQAQADYVVRADDAGVTRWAATGVTSERLTGIALPADAAAEADRQLAFFSRGPFAVDVHQVQGTDWHGELGRVVSLTIDRLGYSSGIDVMVIGVDVDRSTGLTDLTVLRSLKPMAPRSAANWNDALTWDDAAVWGDVA